MVSDLVIAVGTSSRQDGKKRKCTFVHITHRDQMERLVGRHRENYRRGQLVKIYDPVKIDANPDQLARLRIRINLSLEQAAEVQQKEPRDPQCEGPIPNLIGVDETLTNFLLRLEEDKLVEDPDAGTHVHPHESGIALNDGSYFHNLMHKLF